MYLTRNQSPPRVMNHPVGMNATSGCMTPLYAAAAILLRQEPYCPDSGGGREDSQIADFLLPRQPRYPLPVLKEPPRNVVGVVLARSCRTEAGGQFVQPARQLRKMRS